MSLFSSDREQRNKEIDRLVFLSQRGDTESYARLYDHFVTSIYRYIYYRVNLGDAEDLTEMVFLKAWENLPKYRKMHVSFSAWLFKIARNLVIDYYRMNTSYAELDSAIPDQRLEANPEHMMNDSLNQKTLKKALHKLKEPYQQVIILKFINDLSNTEISRIMGRKEGNIRVLQFRALQALKKVLEAMDVHFSM